MAEKSKSGFGGFLRMLFHRSNSKTAPAKADAPVKSGDKKRSVPTSKSVDFGIGETEKLRHFQRARPPANRR